MTRKKNKPYDYSTLKPRACVVCHQMIQHPSNPRQNTHEGECRRLRDVRMQRLYHNRVEAKVPTHFSSILLNFSNKYPTSTQDIFQDEYSPNYGISRTLPPSSSDKCSTLSEHRILQQRSSPPTQYT